ncbi:MAG: hypothetical protein KatS3mg066_2908 [Fischerella sp.]|nr:MAG: hypothetical protein KatS3mg066_2908 [Fischerella sp.]
MTTSYPSNADALKTDPFNLVNPRYSDYWRGRLIEQYLGGRSFYQVVRSGQAVQRGVRQAIPANFLSMAASVTPGGAEYQRSSDRARNIASSIKIPDTSRESTTPPPTVKPAQVALPYRYIPGNKTT